MAPVKALLNTKSYNNNFLNNSSYNNNFFLGNVLLKMNFFIHFKNAVLLEA